MPLHRKRAAPTDLQSTPTEWFKEIGLKFKIQNKYNQQT